MSLDGTSIVISFEPLSISERRGVIVVAVFALLSALALALIALRIIRLALILFLKRNDSTSRPPEILFFRTQLGNYAGSLLLSNMFISAAELIDFSWVLRSGVARGSACSAQAVLIQIGIWGTCWFTVAHGAHTLSSLGSHVRPARWRSWANVGIGWAIAFVAALAPLRQSNVYGPTGTSCSIVRSYPKEILVLEALPIILGAVVSAAVYSVISIVLHGKLSANSTQELRSFSSASQRGQDRSGEYYKFIRMIIRTMFWLPLAFVLLLLPSCVTHIIYSERHSVPFALRVFADVCVSSLGCVNVVLLSNTFRVISPVYYGPRATKTVAEIVNTSGHEASGESYHVPQPTSGSQPTIPPHENSRQAHNSAQPSSNHLGNSWVDWNTKLPSAENAFYGSGVAAVELSRYPRITWPQSESNTWRQDIDFRPDAAVDLPSPPHVSLVTGDTLHEPSIQDETSTFQPMPDTKTISMAKEPAFRSKAPPPLTLSRFSVPGPKANIWNPDNLDESISRPFSHSSSAPTTTLNPDNYLDHSVEAVDIRGVRPLPPIPELGDDEQDIVGPHSPTPRNLRTQSYMTVTSVWSQESGHTIRRGEP